MPSTHDIRRTDFGAQLGQLPAKLAKGIATQIFTPAVAEINGYIAIRDGLLSEAERKPTPEALRRTVIANDLVENCLKPARSPYEAQFLPEADAAHERKRCEAARQRLAELGVIQ